MLTLGMTPPFAGAAIEPNHSRRRRKEGVTMDGKRIDWLARMMARGSDRRGVLKTIAAGTLGGAALVQAAAAHVGAQDAPGEDWVKLYEALAAAVDPVTGECSKVSTRSSSSTRRTPIRSPRCRPTSPPGR